MIGGSEYMSVVHDMAQKLLFLTYFDGIMVDFRGGRL